MKVKSSGTQLFVHAWSGTVPVDGQKLKSLAPDIINNAK
jgi:hypothetical protein